MPFLDADALRTDPGGMAFLRSVIGTAPRGAAFDAGAGGADRARTKARPGQGERDPVGSAALHARLALPPPRRPGRFG